MRTLAGTFSTRDEAEAVSRRLEAIGISPDRITQKVVEGSANTSSAGGVFMTVKVTTDQVQAASQILKEHPASSRPAFFGADRPAENAAPQVKAEPEPAARPIPARGTEAAAVAPRADQQPQQRPVPAKPEDEGREQLFGGDWNRLGRYVALILVVLVGAFLFGAGLGLLT